MRMTRRESVKMQFGMAQVSNQHDAMDVMAAPFSSIQKSPASAHDDAVQAA